MTKIINHEFIAKTIGLNVNPNFECLTLGLVNSKKRGTLSFIDDERFVKELNNNPNIIAVITTSKLSKLISGREILYSEDPRHDFYSLYNHYAHASYIKKPSVIHETAKIHPKAFVSDFNVEIGENCIIEPNATILPDVIIGNNSIVRAGAVIGAEGFEHKKTTKGILSVEHVGKVIVGDGVEIGSNSCIAKGMYLFGDTIIGSNTKINTLARIAHCVVIKNNCFIHGCVCISGSVQIADNVWVGPNATIANGIIIGENAYVSLGSVVTKNVPDGMRVSGNFAIEHSKFIKHIKDVNSRY